MAASTTTVELGCLDGRIAPASELTIPATDEGLLRGDGVFEVLRVYRGTPFALREHLDRLERSAANLRLGDVPRAELEVEIPTLLAERGDEEDRLLRLVLTRGGHRLLLTEPAPDYSQPVQRRLRHLLPAAHPRRRQVALLRRQHARHPARSRARLRRGAARHSARTRAGGSDDVAVLGRRGGPALHAAAGGPHPRLDHPPLRAGGRRGRRAALHQRRDPRRPRGVLRLYQPRGTADRACREHELEVGERTRAVQQSLRARIEQELATA